MLAGGSMSRVVNGLLGIVFVCAAHFSWADDAYSQGLFWKVKPPKGAASVLVGSIHVGDPKLQPQFDRALDALKKSQRLVLEMDLQEIQKVGALLQSGGDVSFKRTLDPVLVEKTQQALLKRGIPQESWDRIPTWSAILILAVPAHMEPGMDVQLLTAAQTAKRPVSGLETAQEQIDSFRKLPLPIQQGILSWQIAHQDQMVKDLQSLIDIYQSENLQRLKDVEFEANAPDTLSAEQQALVFDQLINQRNTRMLQRMQPYLKAGKALIAVGAMHLPGLLEELTTQGFTVEPLEK